MTFRALMMMVSHNSFVRQKERTQGEEAEGGGFGPIDPTRSGLSDAKNRRKHGRWCRVLQYIYG